MSDPTADHRIGTIVTVAGFHSQRPDEHLLAIQNLLVRPEIRRQVHRYRYTAAVASETYSRHLIRMARRKAGLSQQALAERAKTSQAAISAYESGRRSPSVDTLCRILDAAGFEVRMRLADPDTHTRTRAMSELLLPADQVAAHTERERERVARHHSHA